VKIQFDDPTSTWARRFNGDQTTFAAAPDINMDGSGPVTANVSLVTYVGSLQGTVTDVWGNPLAGIAVTVKNPVFGNTLATRTTDGSGHYEVTGLDPYGITVAFVDPTATFAPVKQTVTIESGTASVVDVQLVTGGTVSGTVTAGGTGRAGIAAIVLTASAPVEILGIAYTAADGTYAIPNVPPGDHKLLFADPGVFTSPRTGLVPVFYGGLDALTYGLNVAYDSSPTISVVSGETYTADQAMAPIVAVDVGSSVTVPAGESTFLFVTVCGFDVTGTVTFSLNGVETTAPLYGVTAWFETPTDLAPGSYEITVRYDGDASNEPAWAAPVTLIVT
jgi:hypothetical protein